MNEKLPILISDNTLDITDARSSVTATATFLVKDLKEGQYLLAGAKLKMLEDVAKQAKELIKDQMQEEFDLRGTGLVPIGTIQIRLKSRQDNDYTTCQAFNTAKARLDRIKEKMDICDREYYDDELKVQINPPAKKNPISYLEFRMK